jgi:hypothetical protein
MEKRSKAEMTACPTGPSSAAAGSEAGSTWPPWLSAASASSSSDASRTAAAATLSEARAALVDRARTLACPTARLLLAEPSAGRMSEGGVADSSADARAAEGSSARRRRAEGRTRFMAGRRGGRDQGRSGMGVEEQDSGRDFSPANLAGPTSPGWSRARSGSSKAEGPRPARRAGARGDRERQNDMTARRSPRPSSTKADQHRAPFRTGTPAHAQPRQTVPSSGSRVVRLSSRALSANPALQTRRRPRAPVPPTALGRLPASFQRQACRPPTRASR